MQEKVLVAILGHCLLSLKTMSQRECIGGLVSRGMLNVSFPVPSTQDEREESIHSLEPLTADLTSKSTSVSTTKTGSAEL